MTHTCETLGYERELMFPKYHADVMAGRALNMDAGTIEDAQDRVCMRRHLRRKHGDVLRTVLVTLVDLNTDQLSDLIIALEGEPT